MAQTTLPNGQTVSTAQDLINAGYYGYQGWKDTEAIANYNATKGSGKGNFTGTGSTSSSSSSTGNPLQDVNNLLTDSFTKLNTEATKRFGEYQKNNPFNLDQVLAEKNKQAAEQIDPYYNETITNYLTGINNKIQRSKQDAQSVLDELNTQASNFTDRTGAALARSIELAKQGYADVGLLNSGAALGTQGETTVSSNQNLADYLRTNTLNQQKTNLGLSRGLTDVGLAKSQDVRNIERQRFTDVNTRAADLAKEAGQQYVTGFQATLPPELQASMGNFDLLRQLGIS